MKRRRRSPLTHHNLQALGVSALLVVLFISWSVAAERTGKPVDLARADHGPSKDFIVHQIASGAGVPGLENLAELDKVPEVGAWIVALPMKITGGSGGPLRIVALIPE